MYQTANLEEDVAHIESEAEAEVNLIHDVSTSAWTMLVQEVCSMAGIMTHQVGAVGSGLPCESYSHADASNISRGNHHRDHSDPTKPPRSLESCRTPADHAKRCKAICDDDMCKNILASFFADRKRGLHYELIMENPVGSLRQRPFMRGEQMEKAINRTTVDYCAYGKQYRKSTDIWTSFDWTPNGSTGNGKCNNGQCGMGTENAKGRFMHHLCIAGASGRQLKGKNVKKQLWSVPNDLTLEVMRGCSRARKEHKQSTGQAIRSDSQTAQPVQSVQSAQPTQSAQTTQITQKQTEQMCFIDFFSGGESWREAAESAGMVYLPVDIKTLTVTV